MRAFIPSSSSDMPPADTAFAGERANGAWPVESALSMQALQTAPVIIGAGPAGSAAAIHLARAGSAPLLIERTTGPTDKVCGDFLGADAIERLAALGVDPADLGAARIDRLRLIHRDRVVETALPFAALGLSRRSLDEALLRRAVAVGASVRRGCAVRHIGRQAEGWLLHTTGGAIGAGAGVFLATGKHDLRAWPRPGAGSGAVGLKMYYRLAPAQTAKLAGSIELTLFPGGYAGLQCVEAGGAVLCIAVTQQHLRTMGGRFDSVLANILAGCPLLAARLGSAEPRLPRALAVAGVPYGLLHRPTPAQEPDLFRLGDQAAAIPSLTGDGIAIALQTGVMAAQSWQHRQDAVAYHRRVATGLGRQMQLATLLHRAALTGAMQAAAVRGAAWFPALLRHAAVGTRVSLHPNGGLHLA